MSTLKLKFNLARKGKKHPHIKEDLFWLAAFVVTIILGAAIH